MYRILKDNGKCLALIAGFLIVCSIYLSNVTLERTGDGAEYILQVISVQNQFSFGISEQDMLQAKEEFYNEAEDLESTFYNYMEQHPYNGKAYCNHYGFYSLLVVPVKLIIQQIGLYPLWAFPFTNLILWTLALLSIVFCLKTSQNNKLLIVLLSIANPAFFYLTWIHTEIYIFSFTIIGLVFFYNKQYGKSILFFSIAAMQNVAILPYAMMVGIDYIVGRVKQYKDKSENRNFIEFVKQNGIRIILYGIFYIPATLPLISTYIRFGTFSLVADVASENEYLLHKALDYLFDLNIGILPYEPIVLLLLILLLLLGLKKCARIAIINLVGMGGIIFIISNQIQINCGMQAIMRYNVWIIPIMYFYVIMVWNVIFRKKNKGLIIVVACESVFTVLLITYVYTIGGSFSYTEFAPWTEAVMNIAPQLYNPSHGIFYTRTLGVETYYSVEPVVYINDEGYVRKILLSEEAEDIFYSDEVVIADDFGNKIDKSNLSTVSIDQGDYKYVNIVGNYYYVSTYELGTDIWFYTEEYNADRYAVKGLSIKEDWGSWTDGEEVTFCFYIEDKEADFLHIYMDVGGVYYSSQSITILVNDEVVEEQVLDGGQEIELIVENPETNILKVTMKLPDAVSPSEVVESSDERILGLALRRMSIS